MVDLETANVLVKLAIEQGVGLAAVGDTHQALPVGHGAAMGSAIRHANAAIELDTVHRFRDPNYAALTLRLRNAGDRERAVMVAGKLAEHGHVDRVEHNEAARERMIDAYFDWHARGERVTLVPGSNAVAGAINDAIQQRRVNRGELEVRVAAWGLGQRRILVGDTVQTRRNHRLTGVENRAQWIVRGIRDEHVSLASVSDSGELLRVPTDYAREHLQRAYASTVQGVQGDTADGSVVRPDVDAAGSMLASRAVGCATPLPSSRGRMPRPRVPRRVDAARHSGADDAGFCARCTGGGAARCAEPGGGRRDGAGGWGAECGARDEDI
jgi:ATP-dependent exoDNAse (exonuclease V) alpha subunit